MAYCDGLLRWLTAMAYCDGSPQWVRFVKRLWPAVGRQSRPLLGFDSDRANDWFPPSTTQAAVHYIQTYVSVFPSHRRSRDQRLQFSSSAVFVAMPTITASTQVIICRHSTRS